MTYFILINECIFNYFIIVFNEMCLLQKYYCCLIGVLNINVV